MPYVYLSSSVYLISFLWQLLRYFLLRKDKSVVVLRTFRTFLFLACPIKRKNGKLYSYGWNATIKIGKTSSLIFTAIFYYWRDFFKWLKIKCQSRSVKHPCMRTGNRIMSKARANFYSVVDGRQKINQVVWLDEPKGFWTTKRVQRKPSIIFFLQTESASNYQTHTQTKSCKIFQGSIIPTRNSFLSIPKKETNQLNKPENHVQSMFWYSNNS